MQALFKSFLKIFLASFLARDTFPVMSKKTFSDYRAEYGEQAAHMKVGSIITIPADAYQKLYYASFALGHRITRRRDRGNPGFIMCKRVK